LTEEEEADVLDPDVAEVASPGVDGESAANAEFAIIADGFYWPLYSAQNLSSRKPPPPEED